jgi:hypothetical protein
MTKVVSFTKPKHLMPAHWRKHVEALKRTEDEINTLRARLRQEASDFSDRMNEDLRDLDSLTSKERQVVASASRHLDKCVRDALVLLGCAAERVGYATPEDLNFEFGA